MRLSADAAAARPRDAGDVTDRDLHILIAYDGSPDSVRGIEKAARLFGGARATVATCWRSVHDAARAAHTVMPAGMIAEAVRHMDDAAREAAAAMAAEGAQLAADAGLRADSCAPCAGGAIWAALVHVADEEGADVVVVGSRGHSELRSFVLGSTAHGVVHHARVPVLVVGHQ